MPWVQFSSGINEDSGQPQQEFGNDRLAPVEKIPAAILDSKKKPGFGVGGHWQRNCFAGRMFSLTVPDFGVKDDPCRLVRQVKQFDG
jgi:hypothetical protein